MAIDYREVLKDLRAEESRLEDELEIIRGMIPGAELMAKRMIAQAKQVSDPVPSSSLKAFTNMGTKEAILHLLGEWRRPMMPSDMTRLLIEGGIQTKSQDFAATVGSTLTQLKADRLVMRVEDGWVLMPLDPMGNPPMNVPASSLREAIVRTPLSSQ